MSSTPLWRCDACKHVNRWAVSVCRGCSQRYGAEPKIWACASCGNTNDWSERLCTRCGHY